MTMHNKKELVQHLLAQITANKKSLIEKNIINRTRYVSVVLEDTFQPFNASAIIRTSEIFGIQDIHAIEQRNKFAPTMGVSKGAIKWIDIYHHPTAQECITMLKNNGYKIVATMLDEKSISIHDLPLDQKVALFFGTELVGLTSEIAHAADYKVHIPMFGFTQSFNVSVSVALCLQSIIQRLHHSDIIWRLNDDEQLEVQLTWLKRILDIDTINF